MILLALSCVISICRSFVASCLVSCAKKIPDGSIDSKAASTAMARAFKALSGILDTSASTTGFWMLYGTPRVNGAPFVWTSHRGSGRSCGMSPTAWTAVLP
jgi:hypothetical protein